MSMPSTRVVVFWLCTCCFDAAAASAADIFKTLHQLQQEEAIKSPASQTQSGGAESTPRLTVVAPSPVPCPDPAALDFFKYQIAYQRTEQSDPLRGLPFIHADVWMRGPITAFYVTEKLSGFVPSVRMAYVFGEDGLRGGGTCPADQNWKECVQQSTGVEYANNVAQTCTTTIDLRAIPAWKPSPDDSKKRQIADELRREIEAKWRGAQEIVIRDFNLKDNQITIYVKMPDGDYFQGCGFHAMREPHCGWHLFGMAPLSSIRKWIFDRPYRLK
jgi:hypothetical protein